MSGIDGESPELKKMHEFFRAAIYFLVFLEIIVFVDFGFNETVNAVLIKIKRIAIYNNIIYSKLFILLFILLTCTGTKARKKIDLKPSHIFVPISIGFIFFFGSIFFVGDKNNNGLTFFDYIFIIASFLGALLLNLGFDNISKFVQHNLMKDRFNIENESFEQTHKLVATDYSVNIPMSFYYRKKRNKGWINIVNPFRGTLLIGTPGSGKSFTVVNQYIRQLAKKGFSLAVYDFKFPDLARVTYYQFLKNKSNGVLPQNAQFYVVNFSSVERSVRLNPLKREYIATLADAVETSEALVEALRRGANTAESGGTDQFFTQSAINFMAAIVYFFSRYEDGKYSDLPHMLAFMNKNYEDIFNVLFSDPELQSLLSPFHTAYVNKAFDQLEGQIGTLKVQIARLATKESFWILTEDPRRPSVNLKISDKDNPAYLIIANDPQTQNINSALNALMLNRLIRLINTRGNKPCAIIIDELPTLYFHKIANLLSTARSMKVAVLLGLQELPQLRVAYNRQGADEITGVCGNILAGQAQNKDTLDWLEKLFGKVKQLKENLSIDRNRTTVSLNENMDFLIPASKIASLQTGEFVGRIALDYGMSGTDFVTTTYHCRAELDLKTIEREECNYVDTPQFYRFASDESREKILFANFQRIYREVEEMIEDILLNDSVD
jgi:hypothetical protein